MSTWMSASYFFYSCIQIEPYWNCGSISEKLYINFLFRTQIEKE